MKQTLPLKYRPKYLRDIIGQDVLVQTIKNSIKYDRIASAFLLTGSHGIGKTTTARIIAALLNCLSRVDCEPCGKCRSCIEIFSSSHPDIMEIDAASNTGVDNIRTIIDNTSYLPNYAVYRIYIIDEVHMLSINAFNALLKTLEEPPKNIIFILATTDLKKVPKTIVSRCQRFHLSRMRNDILTDHLQNICEKEEIKIDKDGLSLIVQSANGSVRDALILLEHIILYSMDKIIELNIIREVLGLSDINDIEKMLSLIIEGNMVEVIALFEKLYSFGIDINSLFKEIADLLSVKIKELIIKKETTNLDILMRLWQAVFKGFADLNIAPDLYVAAEMILIRMCCLAKMPSIDEILTKNPNTENDNIFDALKKIFPLE